MIKSKNRNDKHGSEIAWMISMGLKLGVLLLAALLPMYGIDASGEEDAAATVRAEVPPQLRNYDPAGLIRFKTVAEAEARRDTLIRFIWAEGLPTDRFPEITRDIGSEVFSGDLDGMDAALAASVDRLDANVVPYDFHGVSYLIHPVKVNDYNRQLIVVNSGHRADGPFSYGVNDAINRFLEEGFSVLASDMPLVGFNRDNTLRPSKGSAEITLKQRGTAGHREMFKQCVPDLLPRGEIFRLFLEPMVQGVNQFLTMTPDAGDVSFIGLSGGGWTGHMLAALDPRIRRSFPVAGAMPLYARDFSPGSWGDDEQFYPPLYAETDADGDGIGDTAAGVASWLEIFALGGLGNGREQVQILNLHDNCCFSGYAYLSYAGFVTETVQQLRPGRWECYSDDTHDRHLISPSVLNKVIIPKLLQTPPGP